MLHACIYKYWLRERDWFEVLKTGYFWGTESLRKRRWASVAVPPRRKCSTNANGCWENVYALTFHPPIPPRRQANRPSQQALGIHLLSSSSICHKQWTKAIFFNKFLLVFGSIGYQQVPPPGKGSLYVRPLLIGTGPVLGLAPAPDYTFLIYASPVGNYFKVGSLYLASISQ